ncbi:MAG: efflux RND transporter periplasmic adaptor subunit [Gemmataceae bacterium]
MKVDLSQLAVTRDAPPPPPLRRRGLLTRFVLPGLLLAGFAALVGYAARESLSPPRPVTVIPVTASLGAMDAPADTPLFRAAGWVEPRPTPTVVTALAEGVVERLMVVEGQDVKEGQTVARLVAADARLAVESAEAEVERRESELSSARVALKAARARHDGPFHLQADLADADNALAKVESEAAVLPNALAAALARLEFSEREYDTQRRASAARISLAKASSDRDTASGALKELQAREKRLPVEVAALKAKREAQKQRLDRKVDEARQVGEAEAAEKAALARLRGARAARDMARLRLERMEVKAPAAGRVLALFARPGTRLNGMTASSLQDSSTVVTLYDPASLQARVDVRLDDVMRVRPGQKVRIESAALPEKDVEGRVLLATSQADVQKNTLSVKVAIHSPAASLRPEMLCQVTFLSSPPSGTPRGEAAQRLLVPKQLIDSGAVWVVDQLTGTARRRHVVVGLSSGDLVEVISGLAAQDKLIAGGREGLKDSTRVRVTGEDESLGIAARAMK